MSAKFSNVSQLTNFTAKANNLLRCAMHYLYTDSVVVWQAKTRDFILVVTLTSYRAVYEHATYNVSISYPCLLPTNVSATQMNYTPTTAPHLFHNRKIYRVNYVVYSNSIVYLCFFHGDSLMFF